MCIAFYKKPWYVFLWAVLCHHTWGQQYYVNIVIMCVRPTQTTFTAKHSFILRFSLVIFPGSPPWFIFEVVRPSSLVVNALCFFLSIMLGVGQGRTGTLRTEDRYYAQLGVVCFLFFLFSLLDHLPPSLIFLCAYLLFPVCVYTR